MPRSCAGTAAAPGPYYGTTNACIGSEIPFEKALVSVLLPILAVLCCHSAKPESVTGECLVHFMTH